MNEPAHSSPRRPPVEPYVVAALALTGAALRLWYMWEFSAAPNFALPIGADVEEYYARAREIAGGRLFPAVPEIHAPVYSVFLAACLKFFGCGVPEMRGIQLALNFGAWIAFFLLLRRSGVPVAVRLAFLGCGMLLPVPVFYQAELVSESLLLPLAAVVFWLLYLADEAGGARRGGFLSFAAGGAIGVMNLTHPLTLLYSVSETVLAAWRGNVRRAALLALGVAVVIGTFCTAKSLHYGAPHGIQGNAAFNLYLGNNPRANGLCYLRPGMLWRKEHRDAALEAAERGTSPAAVFRERIADFWLHHPFRALGLWLRKALLVFSPVEYASGSDIPPLLCFTRIVFFGRLLTPGFFLLAGFGLWRIFRRGGGEYRHFLLLFFALYAAQIIAVTSGRYRLLMMLPLALFAAVGMCCFPWRRGWIILPLAVMICGVFTFSGYADRREEAASLYAEAAFLRGNYRYAEELAAFAERGRNRYDPSRLANLRGAIAERSADPCGAARHYLRAVRLDPEMPQGWMNLGNLAAAAGDIDRAETYYTRALKLAPRSPRLLYNYARFRFNTGRPSAGAVAAALEADPTGDAPWNLAGLLAMREKRFARAAECFAAAVRYAPEGELRRAYWNNRRIALEEQRKHNRAGR